MDNTYVLAAACLYYPGVIDMDNSHYSSAIRINGKFEIYDDMDSKVSEVPSNTSKFIQALFYVKQ